ncbi:MAG: hemolysin family protein [Actinomycetaceae bacterium]|nr:hemolysin family protein [Actinomycetaceae bacterium]MDY6083135.1 hemolysin family protein [Actinomycetaceae bacterium]
MVSVSTILFLCALGVFLVALLYAAAFAALQFVTRAEAAQNSYVLGLLAIRSAAQIALATIESFLLLASGTLIAGAFESLGWSVWRALSLAILVECGALVVVGPVVSSRLGSAYALTTLKLTAWLVVPLARVIVHLLPQKMDEPDEESEQRQEDEIALIVEHAAESDAVSDEDRQLLESVFDLSRTLVREVMVPRTDMMTVNRDQSLDSAITLFSRSGYSRIPVIGETVDDLLGVVYLKDVVARVHHHVSRGSEETVADVMRDPIFVPETKNAHDLLRDMQADAVHIALVVDEYGGIAGLITIEDLVEELVGEIADEHDKAEPEVEDLGDGLYRVPARLPLDDLGDLFAISLDDDDVDTAGGLFAKTLGSLPIAGSQAVVSGIQLSADRFGGRRKRLMTMLAQAVPEEIEEVVAENTQARERARDSQ